MNAVITTVNCVSWMAVSVKQHTRNRIEICKVCHIVYQANVRPALYFDLQTLQVQFFLAQYFLAELARKIVQFLIAGEFSLARQMRL